MGNQQDIFALIKDLTGQANILTIPRAFVDYTGDLETALLLSQLIYWSDRGSNRQGWIWKTYQEWKEEICLTEYAVRKARKKLEKKGILETKLKKANGNPTVHYRLNIEAFTNSFLQYQRLVSAKTKKGKRENEESLTEITTETTNIYNKGAAEGCSLSFGEIYLTEKQRNVIGYYMEEYEKWLGRKHPPLKKEQWKRVTDNLFSCYNPKLDVSFDLTVEDLISMIDKHFKTSYTKCDYNILHFIENGVLLRRMYEEAY